MNKGSVASKIVFSDLRLRHQRLRTTDVRDIDFRPALDKSDTVTEDFNKGVGWMMRSLILSPTNRWPGTETRVYNEWYSRSYVLVLLKSFHNPNTDMP